MKLIACDRCRAVVKLELGVIKGCKCGNIQGKYVNRSDVEIFVKDKRISRILGVENDVRYGIKQEGRAWIIPFDNKTVTTIIEKK